MTATEKAIHIIERGIKLAAQDDTTFTNRNVKISPKGYFYVNGQRCSQADATQALAHMINEEALELLKPIEKRTRAVGPMTWERINKATKDFFFELGEQMQAATQDHSNSVAVRLGHDIPKIAAKNQPRLTNLKRVGVIRSFSGETKSHKMLQLTELGQKIWAIHAG